MKKYYCKIKQSGISLFLILIASIYSNAQNTEETIRWKQALKQESNWYSGQDAIRIADNLLIYQNKTGGWPKNIDMARVLSNKEIDEIKKEKNKSGTELSRATMDNGATSIQMRFLARVYGQTGSDRFKKSFLQGLDYYLKSQYDNGGWPQFYPIRKGYYQHITYNDNAMVNTMNLLKEIYSGDNEFESLHLNDSLKKRAQEAFNKGVQCILNTQIVVKGQPTVWCAQHDEHTLAPANARAYELASFSGAESIGVTLLLMEIADPCKEVINAVNGSVKWFENHKIEGVRLNSFINKDGEKDMEVVKDENAPVLWARFYDLETEQPYFCDRDGIKRKTFAEMGHDRRNGYSWYTTAPEKLLKKYPEWANKMGVKND